MKNNWLPVALVVVQSVVVGLRADSLDLFYRATPSSTPSERLDRVNPS